MSDKGTVRSERTYVVIDAFDAVWIAVKKWNCDVSELEIEVVDVSDEVDITLELSRKLHTEDGP